MTTTIYYWSIFCETDNKVEYIWSETEPTTCPINNTHKIDKSKTSHQQEIQAIKINKDHKCSYRCRAIICDTSSNDISIEFRKASRVKLPMIIVKSSDQNSISIKIHSEDDINQKQIDIQGSYLISSDLDKTWTAYDNSNSQLLQDTTVQNLSFYSIQPPYRYTKSKNWVICASFEYGGSSIVGEIKFIDLLSKISTGDDTYTARIVNAETNEILCETTLSNHEYKANDMGKISNIPTDVSVLELQVKVSKNKWVYLEQLSIYYQIEYC